MIPELQYGFDLFNELRLPLSQLTMIEMPCDLETTPSEKGLIKGLYVPDSLRSPDFIILPGGAQPRRTSGNHLPGRESSRPFHGALPHGEHAPPCC